jgi:oxygen-independent coproporphyrinogen-3 oxidase
MARAHGFEHLSLDLMYGYPGHSPERFAASLERALELEPEHLSAYAFIADPGNPLGDAVLAGRARVVDDDAQARMYQHLFARSAAAGLVPYETSNVARPGAEARHNLTYWLRRDVLALGPSAHGLWRGWRWGNLRDTAEWASALERRAGHEAERERETPARVAEEIVMLALRLASGLQPADYPATTWAEVEARYGAALAAAVAQGRLERTAQGWQVPAAMRFVADDTIAWLAARAAD